MRAQKYIFKKIQPTALFLTERSVQSVEVKHGGKEMERKKGKKKCNNVYVGSRDIYFYLYTKLITLWLQLHTKIIQT